MILVVTLGTPIERVVPKEVGGAEIEDPSRLPLFLQLIVLLSNQPKLLTFFLLPSVERADLALFFCDLVFVDWFCYNHQGFQDPDGGGNGKTICRPGLHYKTLLIQPILWVTRVGVAPVFICYKT